MSVQFGRWNMDGKPVEPGLLSKKVHLVDRYGTDHEGVYAGSDIYILHRAFHTTKESHLETQPFVTKTGVVLSWDGRLDNRSELIQQLSEFSTESATDVEIVAAAYLRWDSDCFAKLIGDWAVSIWEPAARSLTLAIDPIGTRRIFYRRSNSEVSWSTVLDHLVLLTGSCPTLDAEYIAGWLSFFPAMDRSPYREIRSVPPSCSVVFHDGMQSVRKYWDFDAGASVCYRSDTDYEEHFRAAFSEAVRRRLRSDRPVLAELSGGMDSSSIVCIADTLIEQGLADTSRLDTISYFADSEPNWNERPYFTKIEEKRGRVGRHIDVGVQRSLQMEFRQGCYPLTPAALSFPSESLAQFIESVKSQGHRILLSGIGGDEFLGGVPSPIPELADLLKGARVRTFVRQWKHWSLAKRKPLLHLAQETAQRFLTSEFGRPSARMHAAPWLQRNFVEQNQYAISGYRTRWKIFGPRPSFQENMASLEMIRRQLACSSLPCDPIYEIRYPYLDRSLLEFLFAIPVDQILRPAQRRSLMRRSLLGLVPEEILSRKRKAAVTALPLRLIASESAGLLTLGQSMVSSSEGIVDSKEFQSAVRRASEGLDIQTTAFVRTLALETWLSHLRSWKYSGDASGEGIDFAKCFAES